MENAGTSAGFVRRNRFIAGCGGRHAEKNHKHCHRISVYARRCSGKRTEKDDEKHARADKHQLKRRALLRLKRHTERNAKKHDAANAETNV